MPSQIQLAPRAKEVKPLGGHKLEVTFNNGRSGTVDFKPYLVGAKGLLRALRLVSVFQKVQVDRECGCLTWPNGADWDPDILYWMVIGKPISWSTDPEYHQP